MPTNAFLSMKSEANKTMYKSWNILLWNIKCICPSCESVGWPSGGYCATYISSHMNIHIYIRFTAKLTVEKRDYKKRTVMTYVVHARCTTSSQSTRTVVVRAESGAAIYFWWKGPFQPKTWPTETFQPVTSPAEALWPGKPNDECKESAIPSRQHRE